MSLKRIIFVLPLVISLNMFSQENINFGIKGAASFTGFHSGSSTYKGNFGLSFGGVAELKIKSSISLQAELLYSRKGDNLSLDSQFFSISDVDIVLDYIEFPFQIRYYFIKGFSLDFGPQIAFLIRKDTGNLEFDNINKFDFALNGGLTIDLSNNLSIQARYSHGLTNVFDNDSFKNSVISTGLLYRF